MLKKIEEMVSSLASQAVSIFLFHEQFCGIADLAKYDSASRKEAYRLRRQINDGYRAWYSAARPLVSANLPEHLDEFEKLYAGASSDIGNFFNANGDASTYYARAFEHDFAAQVGFVRSIPNAIESKALALRGLLARDLMDDELSAAHHLLDNGYVREAGVIAGVVLERHLKLLCDKWGAVVADRDTLGQLNDKLRPHYPDDSEYRRVQFLNAVRNSCAHDKAAAPPDADKVAQLVSGVRGFIAAII